MVDELIPVTHDGVIEETFIKLYVGYNRDIVALINAVITMINVTLRQAFIDNPGNLSYVINELIHRGVIFPRTSYLSVEGKYDLMIIREKGVDERVVTKLKMIPAATDLSVTAFSVRHLSDADVYEMIRRDLENGERFDIIVQG